MDILADRLRRAEKKQQAAGLRNIHFVKAEAEEFLECLPEGLAIDEVMILFPDPWPKKRHHKNRLIQPRFLDSLARRLHPKGRLYFRTDDEAYLAWTHDMIGGHPLWEIDSGAPWVFEEPTVFQTKAKAYGSLVAKLKTPSPTGRTPD